MIEKIFNKMVKTANIKENNSYNDDKSNNKKRYIQRYNFTSHCFVKRNYGFFAINKINNIIDF